MGSAERFWVVGRREGGRMWGLEKWTRSVCCPPLALATAAAAIRSLSDARRGAQHSEGEERKREKLAAVLARR